MQQYTTVIQIKLGYTVPFILNSWDKIHKMEAQWEGYPCLSSQASCQLLNSFLWNMTLKKKLIFAPLKKTDLYFLHVNHLLIHWNMDHAHVPHLTQASLDCLHLMGFNCLHLMGFKEPCLTVPQNLVWNAKHSGIFQVLKIQHVWQCIQTFWISRAGGNV